MEFDLMMPTVMTIAGIITLPILLFRLVRLCIVYVKTGGFGKYDVNVLFSTIDRYIERDKNAPSPKQIIKNFFIATHPLTMLLDGILIIISGMTITLFISAPIVLVVTIVSTLFITALRMLRARVARKQEFMEKLNGDHR